MIRQQTVNDYGESIYTPTENLNPSYNSLGGGGGYRPTELEPPTTYIGSTPFGNVKIYDLDAEIQPIQRTNISTNLSPSIPKNVGISEVSAMEIPPIERMQIVPNVPNLPPDNTSTENQTATIAPISTAKKPNYLLYGAGALVLYFVAYKVFMKK